MPPRSAGGGFADILSYKPAPASAPTTCVDPAAQQRVQMLERRLGEAKTLLLITVAAAVLATVFALVALIVSLSSSDGERRDNRIADVRDDDDYGYDEDYGSEADYTDGDDSNGNEEDMTPE